MPHVVVGIVSGVAQVVERQPQTTNRSVTQSYVYRLRIVAHVVAHVVRIGCILQHVDRVRIAGDIAAHKLALETQSANRPSAPVEAHQVGYGIVLRFGFLQARQFEFVQEERTVQPKMVGRTHRNRRKGLRVLVLRVDALG